jgi:hypothetical protein
MDYKYYGHAWCKVKTSNIKKNLVWDLETLDVWGTYVALMILTIISFALLCTTK